MKSSIEAFDVRIETEPLEFTELLLQARAGAVCGIIGAALAAAGNAEIHFVLMLSAVMITVFYAALASQFETPWGIALSCVSVVAGLLGAIATLAGIGIDSYAGKMVSDIHQNSGAAAEGVARFHGVIHSSLIFLWLVLSFGVPLAFFGAAHLAEKLRSKRMGWTALIVGCATIAASSAAYAATGAISTSIVAAATIGSAIWVFIVAPQLWRGNLIQSLR